MAHFPTPRNPQVDFVSLLTMARNLGIVFNETERVISRPSSIRVAAKKQWVLDEMAQWGFRVQLELPFKRNKKTIKL